MDLTNQTPSRLILAIEATSNLWSENFAELMQESQSRAHFAHTEIDSLAINQRAARFYGTFVPLLQSLVTIFTDTYRRFFSLALAHPRECGPDAHAWACNQLQGGLGTVGEWIRDWYALACDGENQHVHRIASIPFVPGETISASIPILSPRSFDAKSWRAPAWLFEVSPLMGFGPLKSKNVPDSNSAQRLSGAHTRLLLKGMRRVFLSRLAGEIATARNEETAAAGAVANTIAQSESSAGKRRSTKPQPKEFEGLRKQRDLSQYDQYMDGLTEKQRMALSLRLEYGCRPAEIAVRMGISRKTAWEHFQAAQAKIDRLRSNDKRKAQRSKRGSE
jgi:DNA-directed RNA polymerase specialized sigma24 family protein